MKEVQLLNRQRAHRIDTRLLRWKTAELLETELGLREFQLAIHFVSARRMAGLNQQFLEHEGSTDVITFDYRDGYGDPALGRLDLAGEIYISVPDALRQADEYATTWQEELLRYIIHGVLHLRGYDDLVPAKRTVMKREENRLLRRWLRNFPPAQISA